MNFYWIYDIPNSVFFLITIGFFIAFSLLGAFIFSNYFEKKLGLTSENNDTVNTFLSISGAFYGITLGLIAVGTFENFKALESVVNEEASALSALYRDVSVLEQPTEKAALQQKLKDYTTFVVNTAWAEQRKGIIPTGDTKIIHEFQNLLGTYQIKSEKDNIIFDQVFGQFNTLIEKQRLRLNSVPQGLPASIWVVLFTGAFVNIMLTWLLVINNKKLDILINTLLGALLGSLIFLIAAMDNPFRGEFSVGAEPFSLLLEGLMK